MTEHNLFYYPYASFTNAQLPLLKVAALYFDKLYILDPVGASWDTIGTDHFARDAAQQLRDAGILETVTPATVLAKNQTLIAEAIRRDMRDGEFLELCEAHSQASGKQRWTLSLAKVPQDLQADQAMRHLMGDFARDVASKTAYAAADYIEQTQSSLPGNEQPIPYGLVERANDYREYAEVGQPYDEYREGYDADVEYRYADLPLALGEAIMMNHALFASMLHAGATPITDDPFHNQALSLKLRRAAQEPLIRQTQANRARQNKADLLAIAALTDSQIELPILSPALPLDAILEYRQKHGDALQQMRSKLGRMARRIEAEPWSTEFGRELEHKTIPDILDELDEARKARDAWLKSERGRLALKAANVVVGAAAISLTLFTTPFIPIALAAVGVGLSVAKDIVFPGAEWLLDWREGKKTAQENGLHYLLKF
jgi:hypothetical protein